MLEDYNFRPPDLVCPLPLAMPFLQQCVLERLTDHTRTSKPATHQGRILPVGVKLRPQHACAGAGRALIESPPICF